MKKILIVLGFSLALLPSCKTSQLTSFSDDIYTNPVEEQRLADIAAKQKAQQEADERAKWQEEVLAQKAKDDNNPYYKDPKSDPDDYYDYKYASRINRFVNPIDGAGYYDGRYTNYYTYNQNPALYGSSIYSSYNWMPSTQFNGYSTGLGVGFGNGFGFNNGFGNYAGSGMNYIGYGNGLFGSYGYNNFGNSFFYDPYNSFGLNNFNRFGFCNPYYNSYYSGYYNGFNNGLNSNWGYFNSYDPNSGYSAYVGPRVSNGGGNSPRNTNPGMAVETDSPRSGFFRSMAQQQENTPRFTETARRANREFNDAGINSTNANSSRGYNQSNTNNNQQPVNQGQNTGNNQSTRGGRAMEQRNNTNMDSQNSNRTINSGNSGSNTGNSGFGGGRSSGSSGSSPRGSGSGGGGRR